MSYYDLITRNKARRSRFKSTAYILAGLLIVPIIYIDPWMIIFAAYHLWLTQFPKDVWSLKSRSHAAAAALAAAVGVVVLLFSIPYFLFVYAGWIIIWRIFKLITRVWAIDCYWCYLNKPQDKLLHCPGCDYISSAKTAAPFKKHWQKQHDGDDDVFNTICKEHRRVG